ncbi:MAG: hypothetical protein KKD01_05215 [Proteobacteria bacterium]|nr:hypothetical protein [Pseudomonadota bacterium]MBU1232771.1 hypothetical protein [Pseudomonadota bacterium]MBU1419029.1 hypothetical protein [Pseudomonadota bacterium]MBU1454109.1 hypothetical protein [Pseudomonadota bacterium]
MNAPMPENMQQFEVYRDILPNDFIKETVVRQRLIQNNRNEALQSMQKMKCDCSVISDTLGGLTNGFEKGVSSFTKLERSTRNSADAFIELSVQLRKLAENLRTQSQMLKRKVVI